MAGSRQNGANDQASGFVRQPDDDGRSGVQNEWSVITMLSVVSVGWSCGTDASLYVTFLADNAKKTSFDK